MNIHGDIDTSVNAGRECRAEAIPSEMVGLLRTVDKSAAIVFGFLEVRQDAVVVPSGITLAGPAVVVVPVASDVQHEVEDARSAQRFTARPIRTLEKEITLAVSRVSFRSEGQGSYDY